MSDKVLLSAFDLETNENWKSAFEEMGVSAFDYLIRVRKKR